VSANPGWSLSTVHDRPDLNSVVFNRVIDGEREPFGKGTAITTVNLPMDATEPLKALDIRIQVDQEITTESRLFILIEIKALDQVVLGKIKNLKPH
jgi:hypothetical protein